MLSYCELKGGIYDITSRSFWESVIIWHKLERDAEYGDIIDGGILCSDINRDTFLDDGGVCCVARTEPVKGRTMFLVPVQLVSVVETNRGDLELPGFTVFHKRKEFWSEGIERWVGKESEIMESEVGDDGKERKFFFIYRYVRTGE